MVISSVNRKHQAIFDDIDSLKIAYQIRLYPAQLESWQPYFHELSVDSHADSQIFLARDRLRLFAGEYKSLLLSGLALSKDCAIKEISLIGERESLKAKINNPSPRLTAKFPDCEDSANARWKCAIELDPDFERQNFEIVITLDNGRTIAYQKIELRQIKLSRHHEELERHINRELAEQIKSIHQSRQLMKQQISQGKNYLFAIGNARSGTTALGELLNCSADICLGIERYSQKENVSASSFTQTSFFNHQSKNYLVRPHFYKKIEAKFAGARYIGDKRPGFVKSWRNTWLNLPNAKIIYIFRNIYDVAHSYNLRASIAAGNKDKDWCSQRNFIHAVRDWNEGLEEVKILTDFYQVYLVKYEDFFVNPDKMARLFNYLEIDPSKPDLSQGIERIYRAAVALESKPRVLADAEIQYINSHASFESYNYLLKLYEQQSQRISFERCCIWTKSKPSPAI